jgi:hypothetical protein
VIRQVAPAVLDNNYPARGAEVGKIYTIFHDDEQDAVWPIFNLKKEDLARHMKACEPSLRGLRTGWAGQEADFAYPFAFLPVFGLC